MADIIKVEHLSYVYNPGLPTAVTALDDVSFTVEEGDFVGIIGATGSGKSTLITHMNGLNKPTSGKIYIDGRDLWADPEKIRDFRFLTGLVFQYPEYQLFEETCYKDIAFGPKNMGLDEAEVDRRVHEAADFVGLDPALLERSPFELSGGQKRRVAVAGVMAMRPRILVLDEPAAGLDPEGRDDILSEVKEFGLDVEKNPQIRLLEYIDNMPQCLSAADLVIGRAGAMTLTEIEAKAKASILIPSPNVAENHQFHNAMALVNRNAARILEEKDLSADTLSAMMDELLSDKEKLFEIERHAKAMSVADARSRIADVILDLAKAK